MPLGICFFVLAAIRGESIFEAVLWLIVAGVIFSCLLWLVDFAKTPEPFNRVLKVILAIGAVAIVINALLTIMGKPFITW